MWGTTGGLEWTWVELIEHLSRFWAPLLLEETDPLGLGAPIELLRERAEERWTTTSDEQRDREEEEVFAYLEAHDLAAGLAGVFPASVFVLREGQLARIAGKGAHVRIPFGELEQTLVDLGEAVAAQLAPLADERAKAALAAWRSREVASPLSPTALATGQTDAEVAELFGSIAPDLIHAPLSKLREPNLSSDSRE